MGEVIHVRFGNHGEVPVTKKRLAAILGQEDRGRSYSTRWVELRVSEGMPSTLKARRRMFVPSQCRSWLESQRRSANA